MNIEKVFYFFFQIKIFQQRLQKRGEKVLYTILATERFAFLQRFTVLFYDQTTLITTIEKALLDIIEDEYEIKVYSLNVHFKTSMHILVTIISEKPALLNGKFRQNKRTFEIFLARLLFQKYHTNYHLECKIEKTKAEIPLYNQVPHVNQKA